MGANILHLGGRGSVVTFFLCGCWVLLPPPDPDYKRGMLATFLVMMALVLLVTVELLGIYLRWLDPFTKRRGKKARQEVKSLAQDMFKALGAAASTIGKVRGATDGNRDNRRRRRG